MPKQRWAMVSGEGQFLNSNSKTRVQDLQMVIEGVQREVEQPLCIVGSVLTCVAKMVIEGVRGKWNSLYVL